MIFALMTTLALMITIAGLVSLIRALFAFFRLFGANVSELRDPRRPAPGADAQDGQGLAGDRLLALKSMAFFALAVALAAGLLLLRNEFFPRL